MTEWTDRAVSAMGLLAFVGIAWLCSSDRRNVPWRIVAWGLGLQMGLGVLLLWTPVGGLFFSLMNALVAALLRYTDVGVRFVGGCCGTTPDHIRKMRDAVAALQPKHASVAIAPLEARDPVASSHSESAGILLPAVLHPQSEHALARSFAKAILLMPVAIARGVHQALVGVDVEVGQ